MLNKRTILLCALLGAITLALYWPARSFDFLYFDDNDYVTNNPHVLAGLNWDGIAWAFQAYWAANWHPLTWISHMLDCSIYGLNAGGHHFTNVLLHSFNAILLFIVLLRMTGAKWRSLIVAAFFAWHPAHVESVAWVAERKDVLSTFFGLLSMLAYAFYVREPRRKNSSTLYYVASLFCFALSLLSKPMLVTMPFVLLLLDYWPFRRLQRKPASEVVGTPASGSAVSSASESAVVQPLAFKALLMEKLPFFILVFISCTLTFWAQSSWKALDSNAIIPLEVRIAHAMIAYLKYVAMMFWPSKLAFYYPYLGAPTLVHAVVALLIVFAITKLTLQWLKDAPYLAVGWFWFLGTLVPVIGFVQAGGQSMADRYTYFPYIGLFIAVVWWASQFWERWKSMRLVLNGAVIAALVACVVLSSIQLQYWRNSLTLGQRALKVTKGNFSADCLMAEALEHSGKYEEALPYAKEGVEFNPTHPGLLMFYGLACLETGKVDEAVGSLTAAERLKPHDTLAYQNLGRALLAQGHLDEAFEQFSIAAEHNPADFVSEGKMGAICIRKQDLPGAIGHYQKALAINPDYVEVLNNLAWIRAANSNPQFRNGPEAVKLAQRACALTASNEPVLLGTLADAYAEAGQFSEAVATATKAHDVALAKNQKEISEHNEQLVKVYRAGRAFHEGDAKLN